VTAKFFIIVLTLFCLISSLSIAQQSDNGFIKHDSTIIFGTVEPSATTLAGGALYNSLGVDVMVSTNGFGLGMFYRHEYSDEFSGFLDFSISEAKDDDEKEFIDYYGQTFVPNKVNRFLLLPLFAGIQKRMFKDDILDNFRPYVTGAVGPAMIYVFQYNEEYFNALGRGRPHYTIGGYLGFGAHFGSERSSLLGLNLRYYYLPYPGGIESLRGVNKTQFGGFYISLSYGGAL